MRLTSTFVAAALTLGCLVGCQKKPSDVLEGWNSHCELQLAAWGIFDSCAALGDTEKAVTAAIAHLENSGTVAWTAYDGRYVISICYRDSLGGIVVVRDYPVWSDSVTPPSPGHEQTLGPQAGVVITGEPSKDGAGYYAPFYSELEDFRAPYQVMKDNLSRVGFPADVQCYPDGSATLEEFASISGKGVVHFSGHGYAYLDPAGNVREVFLETAIESNDLISGRYPEDMKTRALIPSTNHNLDKYAIAPAFLRNHNGTEWSRYNPLVYGGFCFSFLAGWPQTMLEMGASAYVGWDWLEYIKLDSRCACSLYTSMCATPVSDPYAATLAAYFVKYRAMHEYWVDDRMVHLLYAGDPLTTFQEPIPAGWRVGPYNPTFDWIAGSWGTNTLDITFQTVGSTYPLALINIRNPSQLQIGIPVIPDVVTVLLPTGEQYRNTFYQDKCRVAFTKIDRPQSPGMGSVSGVLAGYLYDANSQEFVPVSSRFENVAIYSGKQEGVAGVRTQPARPDLLPPEGTR
ncbi:MAG: hypothetical protein NTX53_03590 [candidate division WOR-3 bacterium]|nr:hypothetical protein [candidate division WOR-3 bacterium]